MPSILLSITAGGPVTILWNVIFGDLGPRFLFSLRFPRSAKDFALLFLLSFYSIRVRALAEARTLILSRVPLS